MRLVMKGWTRVTVVVGFIILVSSAVLYWQLSRQTVETVTVIEVSVGALEQTITATGSVEARRKVLVTAEPGSRIAALYFNEQDIVAHGRVLAKMDDIELVTQRRQMEAALNLAKTNLAEADATLERTRSLYEKGYVARQEVDASQLQVDLYRTQVTDKQAAIQLLKAKIDQTLIRAPVSGAVTRKLVEVGGVVSDGTRGPAANAGGQLQPKIIAEIVHLGALEFHADVDQTDIGSLNRRQRVVVALDAFPDMRSQGSVDEITLSNVEEVSGRVRYKVRVTLEKTDVPLRLGMTGTADFILARKENILTLPSSVVLERDGEASVFVVDNGKAWQRPLRIGLRNEESVEVVSGLQAAEQVIQRGRNKVKDGQAVEVLNGR
jgi:membrane fusion protein, multidrug efflux system